MLESPEIVHFQEGMNVPESDVWLRQKGDYKGTFITLKMLQIIVNEMQYTF